VSHLACQSRLGGSANHLCTEGSVFKCSKLTVDSCGVRHLLPVYSHQPTALPSECLSDLPGLVRDVTSILLGQSLVLSCI